LTEERILAKLQTLNLERAAERKNAEKTRNRERHVKSAAMS
jgi:hypothetical protein